MSTPWINTRMPLDRHDNGATLAAGDLPNQGTLPVTGEGGRIVVAFVDGHAEAVDRGQFENVKVTPWEVDSFQNREAAGSSN